LVFVAEPIAFIGKVARGVDMRVEYEDVAHQTREAVLRGELRGD